MGNDFLLNLVIKVKYVIMALLVWAMIDGQWLIVNGLYWILFITIKYGIMALLVWDIIDGQWLLGNGFI
jgi:hypothetical protein